MLSQKVKRAWARGQFKWPMKESQFTVVGDVGVFLVTSW